MGTAGRGAGLPAHPRPRAGREVELAVEAELELAGARTLADEALAVRVGDLEAHVELGQDRVQVEVEAAVDDVDEGRAARGVVGRARADAALPLRVVAVPQGCLDRLGEA